MPRSCTFAILFALAACAAARAIRELLLAPPR